MSDQPRGWVRATIPDIASIIRGISFPKSARTSSPGPGLVPCLRTTNVQRSVDWSDLWYVPLEHVKRDEQYLLVGDILISVSNSLELVGKVCPIRHLEGDTTLGAFISAIRLKPGVDPLFLCHQLDSAMVKQQFRSLASTTTNIANLSNTKLAQVEISVAPLPEQRRIVSKIEELFSDLDAGLVLLERAQAKLERYRASVLRAAVEGRLTEAWRRENQQHETGEELFKRVEVERVRPGNGAYAAGQADGVPEGWGVTTLGSVLREPLRNGKSARASTTDEGVRTLTLSAVTERDFSPRNTKLTVVDPAKVTDLWLEPDDILIERSNTPELVGLAARYRGKPGYAIFPDLLIRVRCQKDISPGFAEILLQAPAARRYFRNRAKGSAGSMPKINQEIISELVIAVPPKLEQELIELRVERLLAEANRASEAVGAAVQRSRRIRYSILKRAFEGRLVPRGPSDEPADVLLDRIRAHREGDPRSNILEEDGVSQPAMEL